MALTVIYALQDPSGQSDKVYVGKTIRPLSVRRNLHVCVARRGDDTYRSRWLRSLLTHGVVPEIVPLETVKDDGDWAEAERFWIASLRWLGMSLVNGTDGGDGVPGRVVTEETRKKLSASLKGNQRLIEARKNRVISEETRRKIGLKHRGKTIPPEVIAKISASKRGGKATDETRRRMSAALRGRKMPAGALQRSWATRKANRSGQCQFKF